MLLGDAAVRSSKDKSESPAGYRGHRYCRGLILRAIGAVQAGKALLLYQSVEISKGRRLPGYPIIYSAWYRSHQRPWIGYEQAKVSLLAQRPYRLYLRNHRRGARTAWHNGGPGAHRASCLWGY